jgi:LCP family protein required for cell wall assembly
VVYYRASRRHRNEIPPWMRRRRGVGCLPFLVIGSLLVLFVAIYLLAPFRTNLLLLGIDYSDPSNWVGRSDTIILTTFLPLDPYIGMLSIPRDLWVNVPGVGENRINTAHFFAEAQERGSGPQAAMQTIRQNFGVDVQYYVRFRFDSVRAIVNALGGVDLNLPEPMAGYPAGPIHLNGNKALAFARNRTNSDDFFRMQHGQLLIKAIVRQSLSPRKWLRLPGVLLAISHSIETNLPVWEWPRLGFALLRLGPDGIDNRTITRQMVTPVIMPTGANVLIPDWNAINPVLMEMFGQ